MMKWMYMLKHQNSGSAFLTLLPMYKYSMPAPHEGRRVMTLQRHDCDIRDLFIKLGFGFSAKPLYFPAFDVISPSKLRSF